MLEKNIAYGLSEDFEGSKGGKVSLR